MIRSFCDIFHIERLRERRHRLRQRLVVLVVQARWYVSFRPNVYTSLEAVRTAECSCPAATLIAGPCSWYRSGMQVGVRKAVLKC